MLLPNMRYADRICKDTQTRFKGLNHNYGAGDGEIWDMKDMTGDHYPLLAVRDPRVLLDDVNSGGSGWGLYSWDGLCWVDDEGFWYRNEWKGALTAGMKTFASLGSTIVILPDKKFYNVETDTFGSLEAAWEGTELTFANGELYGEMANANALYAEGVDWSMYFREGDAVTISGCTKHPENNKTPVIRQIDGPYLYFYENVFSLEGGEEYTEAGRIQVCRKLPDLKYICQNENRLWGCDDTTIYASKWNDATNWNVYDGLESDSWALTPGTPGIFTGCCSYKGYTVFFKEDWICKIYGSTPSEFSALGTATLGVAEGSAKSLAVAGEILFYLSSSGIMAYTGGIPKNAGKALGAGQFCDAVAGSDGMKYYVSMKNEDGRWLYVYDTRTGLWHKESDYDFVDFVLWEGGLCGMTKGGDIWSLVSRRNAYPGSQEAFVMWMVEFADFTEANPNKKGIGKVQIRLELEEEAWAQVWIQFDSDGIWHEMGQKLEAGIKRSHYLPVIPRRCDHYRLKITGTGGCKIYSLTREYYVGSENRSTKGRN